MNNYKQQIKDIINSANKEIKLAVSWFTDEELLNSLITQARAGVNIKLLLSADAYNLVSYHSFKLLEKHGGSINKKGSENAIDGDFMHAKILIIDEKAAYGGSYNYTKNATSNYENFDQFVNTSIHLMEFNNQFSKSTPLLFGITEDEANKKLTELAIQHKNITSRPIVLSTNSAKINLTLNEHRNIISHKIEKVNSLREVTSGFQSGKTHVNHNAKPINSGLKASSMSQVAVPITKSVNQTFSTQGKYSNSIVQSQPVRPHSYHGGGVMFSYMQERRNRFAAVNYQKYFIDKYYSIFKTKIQNDTLTCKGLIQLDWCQDYEVDIKFTPGMPPKVTLPNLKEPSKFDIHMYDDNSLCLYYPAEQKWTDYTKIAAYTIPWIVEWIYLYEIWKLTGKWEAKESPSHSKS